MTIYETIILNIILIYFPILTEFFYRIFTNSINKKASVVLLDMTITTSFYLVLRYGSTYNLDVSMFLLNIPLLIAYLNNRYNLAIILSTILVVYNSNNYNIPIYIGISTYILYYFIFTRKTKLKKLTAVNIFTILNILIINIYSFIFNMYSTHDIFDFIIISFSFYILSYFTLVIQKCSNKAISFNKSLQDLEREKQLRMSLFQITHEIKNPITVCKGYLDMFNVDDIEHSKKYVSILKSEIKRVLILIEDFMSITKLKINKEIIDVTMLLEENRQNFMPLFKDKKIKYSFDFEDDEIYIEADYNRLNQVLINLIKNSIEATKKNGFINISLKVEEKTIKITVEDNGLGMTKEDLKKISKPFFTTKNSGTGLGLYLCNEIIKAHNGKIEYDSKENIGTKVTVILPYKKDVNFS